MQSFILKDSMAQNKSIHGQWSSRWTFILAAAGSAVGLGNIWKFPYIAGENGGGAFVLFYLLCVIMIGMPILIAEIMLGRRGRQNPINTFAYLAQQSKQHRAWRWLGVSCVTAGFLVLTYYSVIAGWALDYTVKSAMSSFTHASSSAISQLFTALLANAPMLLFWHTVFMLAVIVVVGYGVQKGLERAVCWLFPLMGLILLILVGYAMNSGAFEQGIAFLFNPDFSKLTPNSMLIALGHACFTLSIGLGGMMAYGAYLPKKTSIIQAAGIIALLDTIIALVAGLAIFPIVFANDLAVNSGPGLIFQTLPIAFGAMPYGSFFATLFFIMLVFAAFTSAISITEPAVAWLMEKYHMHRFHAVWLITGIAWFVGIGTVLSFNYWENVKLFGLTFFGLLDYLTANIMLPLNAALIAIFSGWCLRRQIIHEELKTPVTWLIRAWQFATRYLVPTAVGIVMLNFLGII
ncbi:MAG: sodium-dependent transporter [Gammaproteobacteria bacterium]